MDIRNVQKTGDMFYLYLPTRWCKRYSISGKSKVGVQVNNDGSLGIYPQATSRKPVNLKLHTKENVVNSLHKLIVACYISPADSFHITLDKELDVTKILNQKNLVSLELVEIDGNHIRCESTLHVSDPCSLLTTMIRKVRNLLLVMLKKAPRELIERYESEIDRSKLLIEKSVIASFSSPAQAKSTMAELHFLSLISKDLERLVDHVISLAKPEDKFLEVLSSILTDLQELITDNGSNLNCEKAMHFVARVEGLQTVKVKDVETYDLRRIIRSLNGVAEVIVDWGVIKDAQK